MSVPASQLSLASDYGNLSQKQRLQRLVKALESDRESWVEHWKDIGKFFLPRAGRFFDSLSEQATRGKRKHGSIYDSTPLRARRVLTAGLMSGLTSPARRWVRLTLADKALMEDKAVATWLDLLTSLMLDIFRASNTYLALPHLYSELAVFGTASTFIEANFDNVIHCFPNTIGEYALAENDYGKVDTIARKRALPVINLARKFGRDKLSETAKGMLASGNLYGLVPVVHVVKPNDQRELRSPGARGMAFSSSWYEETAGEDTLLGTGGYRRFPALTPRWNRVPGDPYGESPGMEALGDASQLMHEQMRKAQGIDYQTNPPLAVPSSYRGKASDRFPGGIMYYDVGTAGQTIKSAFDVRLDLQQLLADIVDVRERINQSFFVDLFLMIASIDRSNVTAREVAEKQEEKLLMLGPVMQSLDDDLLEPLVDFAFDRIMEARIMPPPPPQMQGQQIKIEFMSILAQAQRAVGINQVDRLLGTVGAVAGLKPEVVDKLDADQLVDAYGDMLGVDPTLIVADDKVAIIREQRAQMQQRAMSVEQGKTVADTAKTLSETDPEKPSVLAGMTGAV